MKGVYVYVGTLYSFFFILPKTQWVKFSSLKKSHVQGSTFSGVALDGYPIYGPLASWHNGGASNLTTSDLDKCHGSNSSGSYRYYMTYDWPYILSCFKGKVIDRRSSSSVSYTCSSSSSSCEYTLYTSFYLVCIYMFGVFCKIK